MWQNGSTRGCKSNFRASSLSEVTPLQPPVPDWNKTRVFLVDPTIWKEYQQPPNDLRSVYQELRNALDSLGAEYRFLSREDHPVDIWIRDWGFNEGAYFRFVPSYAKSFYT